MSAYELTRDQFEELKQHMDEADIGTAMDAYGYRGGHGRDCFAVSQGTTRSGVISIILATTLLGHDRDSEAVSLADLLEQVSELESMATHDNLGMGFVVYYPSIRVDADE